MSLFKNSLTAVFVFIFALLYGCTIEPLYRQSSLSLTEMDSTSCKEHSKEASMDLSARLATIVVEEPSDYFGQILRNRLLFLLYGNGSTPSVPTYQLSLQTSVLTNATVHIETMPDIDRERRPSMGLVTSQASYTLKDMKQVVVAKGKGAVNTSFEMLRQEYATMQAEKNAQKRAAEELAEQIFMMLSKDISKL